MAKRLVKKGVTVVRDGKRVRPEIGKNFDFTADEIERINGVDATALAKADSSAEDGTAETASTGGGADESSAEKSQAAAKGGKKKATANKSDAEAAGDDDL